MTDQQRPIGPKTRPTGVPPGTAFRVARPAPDAPPADSVQVTKAAYCYFRARWERLKHGLDAGYQPPRSYDGRPAASLGQNEAGKEIVLAKASPAVWEKLNRWCAGLGCDPAGYVNVAFDNLTHLTDTPPEPGQLCGVTYAEIWRLAERRLDDKLALALRIQSDQAALRISYLGEYVSGKTKWDVYANVLLDSSLGLSSLFRYCLARSIAKEGGGGRFRRIAQRFEAEAVLQFQPLAPYYLAAWKAVLPPGFADFAGDTYAGLICSVIL